MAETLPPSVDQFRARYPGIWDAFAALAGKCHDQGGPLDERNRRLVKLAIAVGAAHEGAVHSATRRALEAGLAAEDLYHVAVLAITTIGWPGANAAMTWIRDVAEGRDEATGIDETDI
ncbi:MAG: carboxymuconolactone decarboxylase family protein [Acidobacteria bacterium]|nr:carboxymuconolactone decarboxylase family protein [Acidobacteriota bacterium]MBI3281985.1 carboxymuconolactone decarboxylase family protein [Acidobacteriota bacterium]